MSAPVTLIADFPPSDGREWDCQCARCGSSCASIDCWQCDGSGNGSGDFDGFACDTCAGPGHWYACLSSEEWCKANPVAGRETTERGAIEWFTLDAAPPDGARGSGT